MPSSSNDSGVDAVEPKYWLNCRCVLLALPRVDMRLHVQTGWRVVLRCKHTSRIDKVPQRSPHGHQPGLGVQTSNHVGLTNFGSAAIGSCAHTLLRQRHFCS